MFKWLLLYIILITILLLPRVSPSEDSKRESVNTDGIESLSGRLVRLGGSDFQVFPTDDNNDSTLHPTFRTWWFVRLTGVKPGDTSRITISGDGWNGTKYAPPVYSYDGINWQPFLHSEVTHMRRIVINNKNYFEYRLNHIFDKSEVYVARYFPYTFSRLNDFIKKHRRDKWFKIDTIGLSPKNRPIYMITITNPDYNDNEKKRIWVHARTHPSETGSSFVAEGLVDYLLSEESQVDLTRLIFNIVPMVNVDGVIEGLSRNNSRGINLEEAWFRHEIDEYLLAENVAEEVSIIHSKIIELQSKGPEIIASVNLHTFNPPSYLKPYPFVFSNFIDWKKYDDRGRSLWIKQAKFVKYLNENYCVPIFGRNNTKTTSTIDKKEFPESWWWVNFHDKVLAITLETTPEKICCFESCLTYDAHLKLGEALAGALQKYYEFARGINYESIPKDFPIEELMQYWDGFNQDEYMK